MATKKTKTKKTVQKTDTLAEIEAKVSKKGKVTSEASNSKYNAIKRKLSVFASQTKQGIRAKNPRTLTLLFVAAASGLFGSYAVYQSYAASYTRATAGWVQIGVFSHTGARMSNVTVHMTPVSPSLGECYPRGNLSARKNTGQTDATGYMHFYCSGNGVSVATPTTNARSTATYRVQVIPPSGYSDDNNHGGSGYLIRKYDDSNNLSLNWDKVTFRTDTTCGSSGAGCHYNNVANYPQEAGYITRYKTAQHYVQQNRDGDNLLDHNDACPTTYALTANGCPATTPPPPAAKVPLYRVYHPARDVYYLTRDKAYRDYLINPVNRKGYVDRGTVGFISSTNISGSTALYRVYHSTRDVYYLTIDKAYRDYLINPVNRKGYVDKGTVGFVTNIGTADTNRLFRIYHPARDIYYYTNNAAYAGQLIAGPWSDRGDAGRTWQVAQ